MIREPKKLTLKCEGNLSKAQVEIDADKKTVITNDETDPVKAKYSIEYFKKIIGGSKISDKVTLLFDKEYTMKLTFQEVDKVQLAFILAPRVENN